MLDARKIARLLGAARESWGITARELAIRAGLEERQVLLAERTAKVDAGVLATLTSALGGTLDDLLAGRRFWEAPAFALKRATTGVEPSAARDGLLRVATAAVMHAELRKLLGFPDLWRERGLKLGPRAVERALERQAERLASDVRKLLGNEHEPFASVRDAMMRLGVATFLLGFASDQIDGAMWRPRAGAPCAVVNTQARQGLVTALRMSFAHELCHALFDRPKQGPAGLIEMRAEGGEARERRANAFAAYFLAPRAAVNQFLADRDLGPTQRPTGQHLRALCLHFGLGAEAMAWHLVHCGHWNKEDVLRNRGQVAPPFASADDRELRASPIEQQVPVERRGLVLDMATQALEQRLITVARWREMVALPRTSSWPVLLSERSVECAPEG